MESRVTVGREFKGWSDWAKQKKGLMDMGKSVGGKKRMTVLNGNGKGTIKIVR